MTLLEQESENELVRRLYARDEAAMSLFYKILKRAIQLTTTILRPSSKTSQSPDLPIQATLDDTHPPSNRPKPRDPKPGNPRQPVPQGTTATTHVQTRTAWHTRAEVSNQRSERKGRKKVCALPVLTSQSRTAWRFKGRLPGCNI